MDNKIIGFTISKKDLDHSDIDVFSVGIKLKTFREAGFVIYVWGINNIDACFLDGNSFSLSFPAQNSLLDRNVLVKWTKDTICIENDWLGSIPVFYNTQTDTVSTLINKVIDPTNIELDREGFNLYLDIGYSALETTPVKNVKFLRYYSKLTLNISGFNVQYKEDPVLSLLNEVSDPQKTIKSIKNYIKNVEQGTHGNIIIPTSGGFDSRLLNILTQNKQRIRAFTYGVSEKQEESIETVKAKKLSEILNTQWMQIELSKFNNYTKEWFALFGPSTHLHGMYHIEFYKKIKNIEKESGTLLSGIIGDAWSGNVTIDNIDSSKKVKLLGYSHGMNFDSKYSLLKTTNKVINKFFEEHRDLLQNNKMRVVMSMRLKIILLSYLITVPEYFGYPSWTPFLDMKIAMGMLNINEEEKKGRKWQSDFFRKNGLDIESMGLMFSKENILNYKSIKTKPVEPLDVEILSQYIQKSALKRTNKKYKELISSEDKKNSFKKKFDRLRIITGIKRRFKLNMNFLKPYYDILVLKSIELLVKHKPNEDKY